MTIEKAVHEPSEDGVTWLRITNGSGKYSLGFRLWEMQRVVAFAKNERPEQVSGRRVEKCWGVKCYSTLPHGDGSMLSGHVWLNLSWAETRVVAKAVAHLSIEPLVPQIVGKPELVPPPVGNN